MIKLLNRYFKNDEGTTAVEFALVSIIFLSMIFAIFESGRMFWALNTMQYAVEAGTRFGLVNDEATDEEIIQAVLDNVNGIPTSDTNPTITVSRVTLNDVEFLEVNSEYIFSSWLPFLPEGWQNLDLDSSSRLPMPN
jgi:Flp pilus assembly protein TadG